MSNNSSLLNLIDNPKVADIPDSVEAFLFSLKGPSIFLLRGHHSGNCRVVTTLLHANEPSGIHALHHLLKSQFKPFFDTYIIVASVAAAQIPPTFSHRQLPNERDLNRCFRPPYLDCNGLLAKSIIDFIVPLKPQCIIDVHNTSGSGPAFCVSTRYQREHIALASYFSPWLVHTELALGSIMEVPFTAPIITVEAGGAGDKRANDNATSGLQSLLSTDDVFAVQQSISLLHHPSRLKIQPNVSISFSERPVFGAMLTLRHDIERFNFGTTEADTQLGWTDSDGFRHLAIDSDDESIEIDDFFYNYRGELRAKVPLKIFMATSHAEIAKSDCLLYFVDASQVTHLAAEETDIEDTNYPIKSLSRGLIPDQREV
ncbi:hypothetical protein QTP81_07730 [Alteromonas sp. ASW11-36]|uniref:Succinylglutamate desuccinylase n=1 Tax=Alteromonas arenosi TaxID=3055817 RepID=A0ABT7SWB8_9ALTE|nr:hypothetical protein [Alteromonas sp. ASW11-36]MDM7860483.1 hypothetical protein [Alteromonas sp. ASW11-36]